MRCLLLFLALLLVAKPVLAQNAPAARPDVLLPTNQVAPDTAAAIHRLFVRKRRMLRYVTPITFLVVATAIVLTANASETGFIDTRGAQAFGIGLIGGALLSGEALSYAGWSHKKERRALEAWQRHQLPALYRRKLKPKYFQ